MILAQLGMIPSWQNMPTNPPNININPHVQYPPGWTQMTTQPVGPDYASPPGFDGLDARITAGARRGGRSVYDPTGPVNCCWQCPCSSNPCCDDRTGIVYSRAVKIPSSAMRGPLDVFDSPFWKNRKWLVIGGVALLGLAILGATTALLR